MLDLRMPDGNHYARGAAIGIFAPVVLSQDSQRLGYGFVETLRGDLHRILDAARVEAAHLAGSDRHRTTLTCSLFVRQAIRRLVRDCSACRELLGWCACPPYRERYNPPDRFNTGEKANIGSTLKANQDTT
jgi:hypothetical protein